MATKRLPLLEGNISEFRGLKSEVRRLRSENGGQRTEVGGLKAEVRKRLPAGKQTVSQLRDYHKLQFIILDMVYT
ncbi:MAG: hypothetical protein ACUZ8N_10785 [Candidatus Scalindua sp.]